jgi:hypothetical protein
MIDRGALPSTVITNGLYTRRSMTPAAATWQTMKPTTESLSDFGVLI